MKAKHLHRALAGSILIPALLVQPGRAEIIARWTFEPPFTDIANNGTGPIISASTGTGQATGFHADALTDWTTPSGNGSSDAFSSNQWSVGDYYQFAASTVGFNAITLSWDQTRSNTGPDTFDLAYSINGVDFTVFTDNYTVAVTSWSSGTPVAAGFAADLSLVPEINNLASVQFRLINQNAPGGTGGTNRLDNFIIDGVSLTVPRDLVWNPPSADWNAANTNWLDGATPVAYTPVDNAVFTDAGLAVGANITVDAAGVTPKNIRFENTSGTYTVAGGTIGGSGTMTKIGAGTVALAAAYSNSVSVQAGTLITVGANILSDIAGITVDSGATVEIDAAGDTLGPVTLNGGKLKANGTVTLSGNITVNAAATNSIIEGIAAIGAGGTKTVTLVGGGALDFKAALSGGATLALSGTGTVTLEADNSATYTGIVQLGAGAVANPGLRVATSGSLGTGQFRLNTGTFGATAGAGALIIGNTVSLGGSPTIEAVRDLEFTGAWAFFGDAGSKTLTINNTTRISATISPGAGTPTPNSNLAVRGSGRLIIAGTDNAFESLQVDGSDGGTVEWNGTVAATNAPITDVVLGGKLTGSGSLGQLAITEGTVAPGTALDETATLSARVGLSMLPGAILSLHLGGTGAGESDSVAITGTVQVGGTLALTILGGMVLSQNDVFTLISNDDVDAVTGTFAALAGQELALGDLVNGETFTESGIEFRINYDGGTGNDVTLTVIPEPSGAALLLGGLALIAGARRRKQRVAR